MNNVYSCRKIEKALKRDIHFIWLAGYEQPDFNTINRFRNRVKSRLYLYIPSLGWASNCATDKTVVNKRSALFIFICLFPAKVLLFPKKQLAGCSFFL